MKGCHFLTMNSPSEDAAPFHSCPVPSGSCLLCSSFAAQVHRMKYTGVFFPNFFPCKLFHLQNHNISCQHQRFPFLSPLSLVLSSHFQTYISLLFLTISPFIPWSSLGASLVSILHLARVQKTIVVFYLFFLLCCFVVWFSLSLSVFPFLFLYFFSSPSF